MDTLLAVLGGVVGFGVGLACGWWIGVWARPRRAWIYWLANAVALSAGVAVAFLGMYRELFPVTVGGLALIVGGLTGLKYGYAHVVGQWRASDDAKEQA